MKKFFSFIVLAVFITLLAAVCTGCSTPQTIITEFDKDGKITKVTKTGERDAIDKITESTKDKTIIAISDGWAAYVQATIATTEDPTPTGKIFAGKVVKAYMSILPNQQNIADIADIITAIKSGSLSVSQDGITSSSSDKSDSSDTTLKETAAASDSKESQT